MGENIERKTSKCPFCGDEVDLFIFYNGEIVGCKHCGVHITKHTNADRIRAMTDEELAHFISEDYYVPHCPISGLCLVEGEHEGCEECWLIWLKQECET